MPRRNLPWNSSWDLQKGGDESKIQGESFFRSLGMEPEYFGKVVAPLAGAWIKITADT